MRSEKTSTGTTRWQLNRAGIVNVYQYENEVLHFGGGRLLLRGVNGSGKSTAMNMLLPFLLTAHQRGIDAAGEQSAVLRSWMLSGRDEPQPVGYLWLELARPRPTSGDGGGEGGDGGDREVDHTTVGCGIRANQASGNVTTWWFISDQRPGIDFALVEKNTPVSVDALRSALGRDAVFAHDRRPDYRQAVRSRLFGGASLDQHLGLLNTVRSPRVGDRIDLDLPEHLTNALPGLSEDALNQAARPLEDLDEHRRNVTALEATVGALGGIADTYRRYALAELHQRLAGSRQLLTEADRHRKEEDDQLAAAGDAGREAAAARAEITDLETRVAALDSEIEALRQSDAYQDGQQLEELRHQVTSLARQVEGAQRRRQRAATRVTTESVAVTRAEAAVDQALGALATTLATMSSLASALHLAARPPAAPTIDRSPLIPGGPGLAPTPDPLHPAPDPATGTAEQGPGVTGADPLAPPLAPDGSPDPDPVVRALAAVAGAAQVRTSEVGEVRQLDLAVEEALDLLRRAEDELDRANDLATDAGAAFTRARASLDEARASWDRSVIDWARTMTDDVETSPGQTTAEVAGGVMGSSTAAEIERSEVRAQMEAEARVVLSIRMGRVATLDHELAEAEASLAAAAGAVEELASRTEPDPPVLPWQDRAAHCLADLVDFSPALDADQRAGLEAALEASGLLMATVEGGGLRLQSGELVAVPSREVSQPLSRLLTVTVPDAEGIDEGLVAKVLDSVSTDLAGEASTVVTPDGQFRLGVLAGRHTKSEAEAVGATARRATLERLRAQAAQVLAEAEAEHTRIGAERARAVEARATTESLLDALPPVTPVIRAQDRAEQAEDDLAQARHRRDTAATARNEADRVQAERAQERDRVARTHQLPTDRAGLDDVERSLGELAHLDGRANDQLRGVVGEARHWVEAAGRWTDLVGELEEASATHDQLTAEQHERASRLATLEDSLGLPYQQIVDAIETATADRTAANEAIPTARGAELKATATEARAQADAEAARQRRLESEAACSARSRTNHRALVVPGLLGAAGVPDPPPELVAVPRDGPDGLGDQLALLRSALPPSEGTDTTAEGVRISLRRRRDSLGAGWDAEDRQPDLELPLEIHVNGPHGRMPLADAMTSTTESLANLSALLSEKQDQALRELLQGLVAQEVADKLDGANALIRGMNQRLADVTTAHGIGVALRWRRSGAIDPDTSRMIDLLAKVPDLRTPEQDRELSEMLSVRLGDARAIEPDLPYRSLIADVLDYRQWYDMDVLVRRGGDAATKLTRRTPLSEGEKKLVTYLPLFAAVAASCDALAAYHPDVPRFVLLDDAFAKVSEDNHAALFGLLVELDLDLIATSERLWGTHGTVPELAITEVIRDADLGAILLEHAHWDGTTLTRGPSPGPAPT